LPESCRKRPFLKCHTSRGASSARSSAASCIDFAAGPIVPKSYRKNATAVNLIYLDSTYLVRLYFKEPGYEQVRRLAASDTLACAQHGRAEVISAFHRKLRERAITTALYQSLLEQFFDEVRGGAFRWLPLSEVVFERIELVYAKLPATTFLRAADALHLSVAAENGLAEIYSNDTKLLAATRFFALRGVNVIT
jgi:predicted nucleic acid-binding protein